MGEVVGYERQGSVAVLTVDYPPVNALNVKVRAGLVEGLKKASEDSDARAVLLICAGRTFIAGADITEFGKPAQKPGFDDVLEALESSTKPVVAAIHGTALGGGFETALACHYRVADSRAKLGLPEVNLGLIPGAGGTQRLPRVAGVETALQMIVGGAPIPATRGKDLGVVDEIIEGDLAAGAMAFIEKLLAEDKPLVRIRERSCEAAPELFEAARAKAKKTARGYDAPLAAIDAVEAAATLPFDEGLAKERALFGGLMSGTQAPAQQYLFFSEREVQKLPDVPKGTPKRKLEKVAVIGAGTMGGGIAMALVNAGMPVTLLEAKKEFLDRGLETIRGNYAVSVKRGKMTQEAMDKALASITPTLEYSDLSDADLVIEAVFEEMSVKKEVFGKLDEVVRPDAMLATNTSTLNVDEIAAATKHPERVLGLHFFSPANVMKLVEIVRGKDTAPDVVATAMAFAKGIKKVGVAVGVCFGFVGNRMLFNYTREANFMLEEGATPEQIDRVIYDFGLPMGPLSMLDLAGLDVLSRIRKEQPRVEDERDSTIIDRLVEAGRVGQKSSAGYYKYQGRKSSMDDAANAIISQAAKDAGVEKREINDEEIVERCIYPIINEGFKILEEGIALRPADIDVIWVYGYGFPRFHGGPMHYADIVGLPKLQARLEELQKVHGDVMAPAPLLKQLVAEGKTLAKWKRA